MVTVKRLEAMPSWSWPADAAETLLRTFRDRSSHDDERMLAATLAGDVVAMNDEIAAALVELARDGTESEELRGQAAVALGAALEMVDTLEEEDPFSFKTFEWVQEALKTGYAEAGVPKLVRRRMLEASVRAPRDWHAAATRAAFASGDPEWRLTAVFCMRELRGFECEILEALRSNSPELVFQAVAAAGTWQIDDAWQDVVALVENGATDKDLLIEAIRAIGYIRPDEAPGILEGLVEHEDDDIADAAHEALEAAASLDDGFLDDDQDEELS
jgi:hypothetical protein